MQTSETVEEGFHSAGMTNGFSGGVVDLAEKTHEMYIRDEDESLEGG